jgi:hypothetical protein
MNSAVEAVRESAKKASVNQMTQNRQNHDEIKINMVTAEQIIHEEDEAVDQADLMIDELQIKIETENINQPLTQSNVVVQSFTQSNVVDPDEIEELSYPVANSI